MHQVGLNFHPDFTFLPWEMSFRKTSRSLVNTANSSTTSADRSTSSPAPANPERKPLPPGVRLSPSLSLPTVSTGSSPLDSLLGLGAGLALGASLLLEENGTTDYAAALLRTFVSQGITHGHKVFVVAHEHWGTACPGVAVEKPRKGSATPKDADQGQRDSMKIAWRYERMGLHGSERERPQPSTVAPFCHVFDHTTRLAVPRGHPPISYLVPSTPSSRFPSLAPVTAFLAANPATPVRLVLPSLLSPLFYAPEPEKPDHTPFVSFILSLKRLLHEHSLLAAMISWPLALYPRNHTYTQWLETLTDGVLRLEAFPHGFSADATDDDEPGSSKADKDASWQGLIQVRKLPILTERGMGTGEGEEMAWKMGRKEFIIRPFNLPPLDVSNEPAPEDKKKKKKYLEF